MFLSRVWKILVPEFAYSVTAGHISSLCKALIVVADTDESDNDFLDCHHYLIQNLEISSNIVC